MKKKVDFRNKTIGFSLPPIAFENLDWLEDRFLKSGFRLNRSQIVCHALHCLRKKLESGEAGSLVEIEQRIESS